MTYINDSVQAHHWKIDIGVSKGLSILDFLKGYKPPGYKISGLQWRCNKSPSAKRRRVFKLRIYLSTDKVFEIFK